MAGTSSPPAAIRSVPWGTGRRPGSRKATGADRREVGEDLADRGGRRAGGTWQQPEDSLLVLARIPAADLAEHVPHRIPRPTRMNLPEQRPPAAAAPAAKPHHAPAVAVPWLLITVCQASALGDQATTVDLLARPARDVGEGRRHRRPRFPGDEMVPWPGPCHREPPRACQETAWLLAMTALLSVLAVTACLPDPCQAISPLP